MTETEARQFVKRLEDLCAEFERDCGCEIHYEIHEIRKGSRKK